MTYIPKTLEEKKEDRSMEYIKGTLAERTLNTFISYGLLIVATAGAATILYIANIAQNTPKPRNTVAHTTTNLEAKITLPIN
ncbi:MAG: hypothetical protein WCK90_05585 [archaeon]